MVLANRKASKVIKVRCRNAHQTLSRFLKVYYTNSSLIDNDYCICIKRWLIVSEGSKYLIKLTKRVRKMKKYIRKMKKYSINSKKYQYKWSTCLLNMIKLLRNGSLYIGNEVKCS